MKTADAVHYCQVVTCNDTFTSQADLDRHLFTAPDHFFCRTCRTQCPDRNSLDTHVSERHPKFTVLSKDPHVVHVQITADPALRNAQFAEMVLRLKAGLKGRRYQLVPDATHEPAPGIKEVITYFVVVEDETVIEGVMVS